jgi:CBS domain-containing protein
LAETELGPAPVPWLWAACGSQGRREQTGISDQDNCLILDDAFDPDTHDGYFAALAKYVSDGLDTCGFFYCPGDMMATNPRWRQPRRVWRKYFAGWIAQPDNQAQMLASVMFDLRPISGETALFENLQTEVLTAARRNSIFVAHMIANSLKHTVPLGLFRGFALIWGASTRFWVRSRRRARATGSRRGARRGSSRKVARMICLTPTTSLPKPGYAIRRRRSCAATRLTIS